MTRLAQGKRDQRITLQSRVSGTDVLGQVSTSWMDIATVPTVWAMARPVRGSEFFAAGQMQARAEIVFNIRYRSDVTEAMRVMYRGKPYEITAPPIDINGARTDMELICSAGVGDGR